MAYVSPQIFRMDIVRNVSVRETCAIDPDGTTRPVALSGDASTFAAGRQSRQLVHRNSLPHIDYKESDFHRSHSMAAGGNHHHHHHPAPRRQYSADPTNPPPVSATLFTPLDSLLGEDDCCAPISGRLEIRVVPQDLSHSGGNSVIGAGGGVAGSVLLMTAAASDEPPEPVSSGYFEASAASADAHRLNGNEVEASANVDADDPKQSRTSSRPHISAIAPPLTCTRSATSCGVQLATTPSPPPQSGGHVVAAITKTATNSSSAAVTTTTSSKIPVFNAAANQQRIVKCASWAGGECPSSGPTTPEIQDLTPGKLNGTT